MSLMNLMKGSSIFKVFLNKVDHSQNDKYTVLYWLFEQLVFDDQYIKYKIDQAIIKGYIDYQSYKELIKSNFLKMREPKIKNKIASDTIAFHHMFTEAYRTRIQETDRIRSRTGIDSFYCVKYDTEASTFIPSLNQYAEF